MLLIIYWATYEGVAYANTLELPPPDLEPGPEPDEPDEPQPEPEPVPEPDVPDEPQPQPEPADHYALAILEMAGKDYDQNGIVDLFSCTKDFNCEAYVSVLEKYPFVDENNYYNIKLAKQSDLEVVFDIGTSQFIPISPLRINITDLSFTINPIENPYLAYNERDTLYHPSVAISITVDLSEQEALNYPGKFEPITFKTTISAGVVGEIVSYPPVKDFYQEDESSWINDVFSND